MPKRKREDDYEHLLKKFKKLEKKLRRRCRSRSQSSNSSEKEEHELATNHCYETTDYDIAELLDGNTAVDTYSDIEQCNASNLTDTIDKTYAEPTMGGHTPNETNMGAITKPNTSAVCTEAPHTTPIEEPSEVVIASNILEILGEDPTVSDTYGPEIHKDLAIRLEHAVAHGLSKDNRKELSGTYLVPSNCKLIEAPALNPEIKAAISEIIAKRDKNIEIRQKQTAIAISCLGQALNQIIAEKTAQPELVKLLMDTERILCDNQHCDSIIRRNFILSSLKKDMKDQLQNTKPDNMLFGQNLSETIRTAKAINKSGAELKNQMPKPQAHSYTNTFNKRTPVTASTSKNLNWKGPYPPRKPPISQKSKVPPPNRNQLRNSSKPSQQQRPRDRR